ncbi:MAG: radical SAM protein [Candidatus Scalindua sp.]|nr:radical SAM protein [Candidatus Scalindua sp.]MBT6046160.1 radical SAM protein [Candidatus Scalindua sp.]MBT7212306.1 radical SAM protein [Candidatus Scalindua sp.]MBT7592879.1 radical SAM protein [Candidatus Scalindua sp.]
MRVLLKERKSSVLSPSTLKCLNGTPTLNPTAGCAHLCSYCYARGYSNYPGDGTIVLYTNLVEKLENELGRKRKVPEFVYFSPSCDAFQPIKEVLDTTYSLMAILLKKGIGVSFLTKGRIPDRFIALFKLHSNSVNAHIGITTLNRQIQKQIESHAATPGARLKNIRALTQIGILPEIRFDLLIPGLTDSADNLDPLLNILGKSGIKSVGLNYLFLRPIINRNIREGLGHTEAMAEISRAFCDNVDIRLLASKSRVKALNLDFRQKQYNRISLLAKQYGIKTYVCGYKNPDIAEDLTCSNIWQNNSDKKAFQYQLFSSQHSEITLSQSSNQD